MAELTSTPVGKPLKTRRPALFSNTATSLRYFFRSSLVPYRVAVSVPAVMHGRADFNSSRKAVKDQASGFILQYRDKLAIFFQVVASPIQSGGKRSRQGLSNFQQLFFRLPAHHNRARAEYFLRE